MISRGYSADDLLYFPFPSFPSQHPNTFILPTYIAAMANMSYSV